MEWIFLVIGGLVAAVLSQQGLAAPVIGAFTGFLLGMVLRQRDLLRRLEIRLAKFETRPAEDKQAAPRREDLAVEAQTPRESLAPAHSITPQASAEQDVSSPQGIVARSSERTEKVRTTRQAPGPDIFQLALRWLLSGNVPAKVGVVVSFFGVSFLLKFAVDAGYVSFSPAMRVIGVLLFAAVLLWLGWRFSERQRAYAMALFGGGIGLMYLAFFAAFRLYQLLPALLAFCLLAMVAAFSVWLAIRQRAFVLAGLGVSGGFLAPLLASTGSGSHVALFGYYLLINIGIASVAYFRHWRLLNLIGFAFTFVIGLAWGAEYYETRYFASVEPFLLAHFVLYVLIAVLSALRQPFRFKGYVDSALVFGLPLVVFPLQSALVDDFERGMAWSSLGLGIFYVAAWFLLRSRYADELKLLLQSFLALGIAFLTLAVPLWFDAPWVSGTWALEGAGMIWIGLRQQRKLTRWAGAGLMALAVPALFMQIDSLDTSRLLLNARFIGLALIAIPALFAARLHERAARFSAEADMSVFHLLAGIFAWSGLLLGLLAGSAEILEHAAAARELFWFVCMVAALGTAFVLLGQALQSAIFRRLALASGLLVPFLALASLMLISQKQLAHPFAELGWLAWPLAAGYLLALRKYSPADKPLEPAYADTVLLWTGLLLLPMEIHWLASEFLPAQLWNEALALAFAGGVLFFVMRLPNARHPFFARFGLQAAMLVLLVATVGTGFASTGGQQPLPYVPLLNGLALASALAVFVAWRLLRAWLERSREMLAAFAALVLLIITQEIARASHQLGQVPYESHVMLASDIFQAAVSVVWSVLGLAAMGYGARRGIRHVWIAGAILMSCVVLKLFAVDLGNTGTVARIVSFVGVGVLLLVVGYLAPVPEKSAGNSKDNSGGKQET